MPEGIVKREKIIENPTMLIRKANRAGVITDTKAP